MDRRGMALWQLCHQLQLTLCHTQTNHLPSFLNQTNHLPSFTKQANFIPSFLKQANFIPSFSKGGVGVVCKTMSQPLSHLPPFGRVGVGIQKEGQGWFVKQCPNLFPISLPLGGLGWVSKGGAGVVCKTMSQPLSHLPPFGRAGMG